MNLPIQTKLTRYMKNWENCNDRRVLKPGGDGSPFLNLILLESGTCWKSGDLASLVQEGYMTVFDSLNIQIGENGDHLVSQHNSAAYSFPGLLWPPCSACSCAYLLPAVFFCRLPALLLQRSETGRQERILTSKTYSLLF